MKIILIIIVIIIIVSFVLEYSFNKEADIGLDQLQKDKKYFNVHYYKEVVIQCADSSEIDNVMYAYCAGKSLGRNGKEGLQGREWVSSMEGRISPKVMELMAIYFDKGLADYDDYLLMFQMYQG